MTDDEEEELLLLEKYEREAAKRTYKEYVTYMNPAYTWTKFHEILADNIDKFERGEIKKLMITVPPQHGKSELSTRNLPSYLFGKKPTRKIAVLTYSAGKANKFSREIQQRFADQRYNKVFPSVRLATAKDQDVTKTMQEFDVLSKKAKGNCKCVGRGGPLTGDPVDIAILDDLFKDNSEAQSPTIREGIWENWIIPVVETRLHNDSQLIYVTTRWHEEDPSGKFLDRDGFFSEDNPNGWVLLNFPAIKTNEINSYDKRKEGQVLWPERHSLERMLDVQKNSPITFNALYQGDPKPSEEATIYNDWIEIESYPKDVDYEFYGLDFGYSNDPTALTRIGKIGKSLYLDELIYEVGLTNYDILKLCHLNKVGIGQEVYGDSAEPKSVEEIRRGNDDYKGLNIKLSTKGPGSINAGIQKLKEYTVYYTKRSRNIAKERKNYVWIMAGGKATNVPVDAYNHALDGIRGAVFTKYSNVAHQKPKAKLVLKKNNSWH